MRCALLFVLCATLASIISTTSSPSEAAEFPLDQYPGFGRSPEASLRDDTIAYWEAFRRELDIETCMSSNGFAYWPAVAFPSNATAAVAGNLEINMQDLPAKLEPAAELNRKFKETLSADRIESYTQALVGESAVDLAEADRTQMPPAGRGDDFATRGCVGKAQDRLPSVWDLRRQLSNSYDQMRRSVSESKEFIQAKRDFSICVKQSSGLSASDPGVLEEIVGGGGANTAAATAALDGCMTTWDEGYRRAEIPATKRFVEDHLDQLEAAKTKYRGTMTKIRQDRALKSYLGEVAALEKLAGTSSSPSR